MKKYSYMIVIVLTLGTLSCKDKEADVEFMNLPISFDVQTVGTDTRATRYSSESAFAGQSFGIYGWNNSNASIYNNSTVSKTGGKWKAGGTTQYWEKDKSYTFEAVYPRISGSPAEGLRSFTTAIDPGSVSFSYKVPSTTTSTNAKDIMFAYYSGTGIQDGDYRAAKLTFTHPLTCVNFTAGTMTGITQINSISIAGVYQQGKCTVRTTTDSNSRQCYSYEQAGTGNVSLWNTSGSSKITVTGSKNVTPANLSDAAYNFLLIPQIVTTDAPVNVTVNYVASNGDGMSATVSVPAITWRAGYYYTYSLDFTGYNIVINPVTVAPWGTEHINVQLN